MRYGIRLGDELEYTGVGGRGLAQGDTFTFARMEENTLYDCKSRDREVGSANMWGEKCAEITKEEYDRRVSKPVPPPMHPKLKAAFDRGDFGCQEESVEGILEAITEVIKEVK